MKHLCIAGMPLQVESGDREFFHRRYAAYEVEPGQTPQLCMRTRIMDAVPIPEGEVVQEVDTVHQLRLADGRFYRYITNGDGKVMFALCYTPDYSQADILLPRDFHTPYFTLTSFEYMQTGYFFNCRYSYLGGGILHSSSIAYKGQGIAFSANSGTGKSTHVGLWRQCFGEAVTVINDDKPAIYFDGERPILCGTPWSGKTDLNNNVQAPLKAIVIVERGEQNSIRRLDVVEGMNHLVHQRNRPYFDKELGLTMLDFTIKLLDSVPMYALTCNMSEQAVETVFKEIFPEEEWTR